ncbi:papain family cysteine protease [Oesophagostomum dentatum]|uniref:Papain family cysteine protease n=1 Tax=Oesophagostomum dentatum TaxID=61180 RepID=A0A0B1TVB4_OESDE|nr:papain family cysteine protease [Oesophagostomum dentatum]
MNEEEQRARIMDESYLEEVEGIALTELNTNAVIPTSFDVRVKWPACTSIKTIRDQSACGSCWAVSGASTMSDRLCFQSNGKIKKFVSDADILACCGSLCGCGYVFPNNKALEPPLLVCKGGFTIRAWQFATSTGVCTDGAYAQKGVCKPYPFHTCGQRCPGSFYPTPACEKKCRPDTQNRTHQIDLKVAQKHLIMMCCSEVFILCNKQCESYPKGNPHRWRNKKFTCYQVTGWGVEKNLPYRLISNSWNSDWGENDLFRILRGKNECGIETRVVAGMMQV